MTQQQQFIDRVCGYLDGRGFVPRTLGVTDYDRAAPLTAIRRLLLESNGLITVALRRTYIQRGSLDQYFTSPEWEDLITKWEYQVRSVVEKKGNPPQLF